ncbi:MAG: DUF222 domain-containing protein, partial [Mycobacterium sp.]
MAVEAGTIEHVFEALADAKLIDRTRHDSVLACRCGAEDCAAKAERKALGDVVINVLAEQRTVDGTSDHPGYLTGFGLLPAKSVRDLVAAGAPCKALSIPSAAEGHYRPSKALSAFVKWRDLTCRFPGCEALAEACDIDHSKPYPFGPTHPSSTKLYCRKAVQHDEAEAEALRTEANELLADLDNIAVERAERLLTGRQAKI